MQEIIMTKIQEIYELGQSIWYDYIQRSLLTSGKLEKLINEGLSGMTSNPTIFDKAISGSSDYDAEIENLVAQGKTVEEIYDQISLADIAMAADHLFPVYKKSRGRDGFVSIEVNPELANDTNGTCREAKRIFTLLNRPNIMIKVPATESGFPAITHLLGSGVNVNVTLIFSLAYYVKVVNAFLEGLETLAKNGPTIKGGLTVDKIASVASFFVSRVDTYFDQELEKIGNKDFLGRIAVANAKAAYSEYQRFFSNERWKILQAKGAKSQRVLWASTSTKNPAYHNLLYVNELIGPDTVNTVPPATYDLIKTDAVVSITLTQGLEDAQKQLANLNDLGVDYDMVTDRLLKDGVEAFTKSFEALMTSLVDKSKKFKNKVPFKIYYNDLNLSPESLLKHLKDNDVINRIWQNDFYLWKSDPTEITNRLGWLRSPQYMLEAVSKIQAFVKKIVREGFTHALLLGMGGSSLAPEVYRSVFGVKPGYLELSVLDTTDADAIYQHVEELNLRQTLIIVSTKSGGTVETLSLAKFFYNKMLKFFDKKKLGEHFIAITDQGSKLEELANQLKFRKVFLNDSNVGGRFSALTHFGLVPAALIGVDLNTLLERANSMVKETLLDNSDNSGALLGAFLANLAAEGKDKISFFTSPQISSFISWVEQLIAESTGKEAKGILPLEIESTETVEIFAEDRIFVYLKLKGEETFNTFSKQLLGADYPLIEIEISDIYDLGKEFYRWEFATAVMGWRLQINPFNQPDVEAAKKAAREAISIFQEKGKLPELQLTLEENGVKVYSDIPAKNLRESLLRFLSQGESGVDQGKRKSYIAIQAYLPPTQENHEILKALRNKLVKKYRMATTIGYGPRFLHSTGQLHKGDSGKGLFIQIVTLGKTDLPIPKDPASDDSLMTFNILKNAQSLGDRHALMEAGRKIIRFEIKETKIGLEKILNCLD
jgi:transaldolase/glucose-6-phosphate isomerase